MNLRTTCDGCGSHEDPNTLIGHGERVYCLRCRTCSHGFVQLCLHPQQLCMLCLVRPFSFRLPGRQWLLAEELLATCLAAAVSPMSILDGVDAVFGADSATYDAMLSAVDCLWSSVEDHPGCERSWRGLHQQIGGKALYLPPAHLLRRRDVVRLSQYKRWRASRLLVRSLCAPRSSAPTSSPSMRPRVAGAQRG